MGMALMGAGNASGENRAVEAAQRAISSPLLEESSIDGARGVLINVTGGPDLTLYEVNESASIIFEAAHEDAHIIFGSVIDEQMGDDVRVTVIATGFGIPATQGLPLGDEVSDVGPQLKVVGGEDYHLSHGLAGDDSSSDQPNLAPSEDVDFLSYDEKEWDVPTFLRKQAD
jgi:cell division protein FtsZ